MADHMIKLSEVPKGQKMQYLWDYYRIPAIVVVCSAILVISLVKTIFFTPKADVNITFTTRYELNENSGNAYDKAVEAAAEDYNGDGKIIVNTTRFSYDEKTSGNDPQYTQAVAAKINAEIAAGEAILQICDDKLYETYAGYDCTATYKVFEEFGVEIPHDDSNEIVKIPFSSIKRFENIKSADGEEIYITVRPPMQKWYTDEKHRQKYINHLNFIAKLVNE